MSRVWYFDLLILLTCRYICSLCEYTGSAEALSTIACDCSGNTGTDQCFQQVSIAV